MWLRERHRHVQVGHLRIEGRSEDRLVEARVAGVQHRVRADPADQLHQVLPVGGVDALGGEAPGLAEAGDHRADALGRDVGEDHPLERLAALRDRRERRPHATGTNDENLHQEQCDANRNTQPAQWHRSDAPLSRRRLPYAAPIRAVPNTSTR